jgi:ferredoxin
MSVPTTRFSVVILPNEWRFDAGSDKTLLESAAQAGIVLPSSCRNGTCRACICRRISGSIRYRIEWPGLLAEEKAEGFILPCVAEPESDLVIDVPRAAKRV